MNDHRWKQSYSQFKKAYQLLEDTASIKNLSVAERAGLIQFYEMSIELAWKLLKDYLEGQGFMGIKGPKDAVKKAFQEGYIKDGLLWMKALDDRNLTVHTYNENIAKTVADSIINHYLPLLKALKDEFNNTTKN